MVAVETVILKCSSGFNAKVYPDLSQVRKTLRGRARD